MRHPFFIALDFDSRKKRRLFLESFTGEKIDIKVGMELFYREGLSVIEELKTAGHGIFLDLKLHDIPNTVKRTMRALAELEVDIINVHAAGGQAMLEAAVEGLSAGTRPGIARPHAIAVTQLTSTSQTVLEEELLIKRPLEEVVVDYASLAKRSGLDGVVCAAGEVPVIHKACGPDFLTVTPGIRRKEDDTGDQHRVVTPGRARELGSWGIVVGRSVTNADDPFGVYKEMNDEWEGVLSR
ncbi:orotidine-5'-phosphate decarboxylase [Shouchella shacheensis]|uniref:orotidine-5'-phosphate decarboxylase n=1 Tax=Shouchella shacheensis TaxID=1649580 RepID=UPI000740449A|nr:orotidine-5'-phosphate decarboxylase [Shouchella shacheensis]